jgi:Glyoxalase-like domain
VYTKIQVVFDAADPAKLASFWKLALGYGYEPPPECYATQTPRPGATQSFPYRRL